MNGRRRTLSAVASLALATGVLAVVGSSGSAAPLAGDAESRATALLKEDATGKVTIKRDAAGDITFVGTAAGTEIDNPSVSSADSVNEAARAHLNRYGAAIGADRAGTTLMRRSGAATAAGTDVVRFTQHVDGVPVIGGDVVVTLAPSRELVSMLSTTSRRTNVTSARLSESKAATVAAGRVARNVDGPVDVSEEGRWLLDPAVAGTTQGHGARTVWRFEVSSGAGIRRQVLVDDQTGGVLMDINEIHEADRVVCDRNNVQSPSQIACTSGFARIEGQGPTGVADVDQAYDYGGATSDLFATLGIDLTALLGIDVGGVKKLAQTVRWCYTGETCPYPNAFWNGSQMYYGQGFVVDDVVGHEMTHGVTDRHSELFYWGQSGAINESLSDILGEIVDLRHAVGGEPANVWRLGEQVPGFPNGLRNIADPPARSDPDRTGSSFWNRDIGNGAFYNDNGGVHTNSGVGNKTFYLASQGGTFNGQTITGIDAGDATLAQSARLWLVVLQSLSSGSDYADMGAVLDQSCNSLVGTFGFTAGDCTEVHEAGLATELAITPANAPQPADAVADCPTNTSKRVLFDSESGTPASKFTSTAPNWLRTEDPYWGSNAHSGTESWNNATPISSSAMTAHTESLVMASPVALPLGQVSYLHFHGWHSFEFRINQPAPTPVTREDGGTVEISASGGAPVDTASLPWVNGPTDAITSGTNPAAGRSAFTADSLGWVASRLDLSSFAGQSVTPQFSVNYNNSWTYLGWFVDDITVYTCDKPPPPTPKVVAAKPKIEGQAVVGKKLTAKPGAWSPADVTFTYQWMRGTKAIKGATAKKYKLKGKDEGKKLRVVVTGSRAGYTPASATSAKTKKVQPNS